MLEIDISKTAAYRYNISREKRGDSSMENDLISKKELLELTGISYGQLYRWKRKKLIPEEWFIRKSTFTGQETFFPRAQTLERVEKIKNMKGDISLDDLAKILSPNLMDVVLEKNELLERNIVSEPVLDFYIQLHENVQKYDFERTLHLYLLDKLFQSGKINLDEGKMILKVLEEHYQECNGKKCELIFLRKLGVSTCCLVSSSTEIFFEDGMKIIASVNLVGLTEELKIKIS